MSFIWEDLEFCLLAARVPNGSDHTLGSFRRNDLVLGSCKGIDGDLCQIHSPFLEIRSHILRPFRTDSPNDR